MEFLTTLTTVGGGHQDSPIAKLPPRSWNSVCARSVIGRNRVILVGSFGITSIRFGTLFAAGA